MNAIIQHALDNWKTTAAGILNLLVIGGSYLTANPPPELSAKAIGWATFGTGLARLYVALIQKDAK